MRRSRAERQSRGRTSMKSTDKDGKLSWGEAAGNVAFVVRYLYRADRSLYLLRAILAGLQIFQTLLTAFSISYVLNRITDSGADSRGVLAAVLLFGAGRFAISLLKRAASDRAERRTEAALCQVRLDLGRIVSRMRYSDVEDPRVRDFIALASSADSFSKLIGQFTDLVSAVAGAVTYAAIVLYVQPMILVLIVLVVVAQAAVCRLRVANRAKWRAVQSPLFRKLDYLHHVLSRPQYGKEIRINRLQGYFLDRTEDYSENVCMVPMKSAVLDEEKLNLAIDIPKVAQKFLIYVLLAVKVVFDGMRIGDFTLYLAGADSLAAALTGIVDGVSNVLASGVFAGEFRRCATLSEEAESMPGRGAFQLSGPPSIEFRDVSFRYPGAEEYTLRHISFRIEAGESLSLVGMNGSGKTTAVKLLCRFYLPTEGEILINGISAERISDEDYAAMLGVVFQDFRLFSFTVRENVAMGGAEEERVLRSIGKAGLGERLERLEKGLETFVSKEFDESGVEFSGGEGQKLAIARAIYKDAPVIVLDEPTAALDPLAEYDIYKRFFDMAGGRTSIFISHRLSSARFTSRIAVLDRGELREFGTHRELMGIRDGVYRSMFEMQAQYYREGAQRESAGGGT